MFHSLKVIGWNGEGLKQNLPDLIPFSTTAIPAGSNAVVFLTGRLRLAGESSFA